jgi:hypothetical protein
MEGINGVANPINVFTSADLGYVSSDPKGRAAREITRNFFVQDLIFSHNEKGRAVYVPGQSFRFIATPEGGKWNLRAGGNFSRAKREFVDARA